MDSQKREFIFPGPRGNRCVYLGVVSIGMIWNVVFINYADRWERAQIKHKEAKSRPLRNTTWNAHFLWFKVTNRHRVGPMSKVGREPILWGLRSAEGIEDWYMSNKLDCNRRTCKCWYRKVWNEPIIINKVASRLVFLTRASSKQWGIHNFKHIIDQTVKNPFEKFGGRNIKNTSCRSKLLYHFSMALVGAKIAESEGSMGLWSSKVVSCTSSNIGCNVGNFEIEINYKFFAFFWGGIGLGALSLLLNRILKLLRFVVIIRENQFCPNLISALYVLSIPL